LHLFLSQSINHSFTFTFISIHYLYYQILILGYYSSCAVYYFYIYHSIDDLLVIGMDHGLIQWRPYYHYISFLDYVGINYINESLLITRDISLSLSMHQPLMDLYESYIGTMIAFISLLFCIFIPSIAIVLANIIDIYLFGILGIFILLLTYILIIGSLFVANWFYLYLSSIELFIFILAIIEFVSIIFQSITITNRLSINIVAGGFLVNILFLCLDLSTLIDYWPLIDYRILLLLFILLILFDFEIISFIIQLSIFTILLFMIVG
jgi:hypothetical protein